MKISHCVLFAAALIVACRSNSNIKSVTPEQYVTDVSCWGGKENRYRGAGIFAGTDDKFFYIFSIKCAAYRKDNIIVPMDQLIWVKLSDRNGVLRDTIPEKTKILDNYIIPSSIPNLEESIYIVDIEVSEIVSNEFSYMEIKKVNRLDRTSLTFWDLFKDFGGTAEKLRVIAKRE